MLAESKISSIASKALCNSWITNQEFNLVIDEFNSYKELKEKIRHESAFSITIDEEAKQELIKNLSKSNTKDFSEAT